MQKVLTMRSGVMGEAKGCDACIYRLICASPPPAAEYVQVFRKFVRGAALTPILITQKNPETGRDETRVTAFQDNTVLNSTTGGRNE